jgi:hypothetical protein
MILEILWGFSFLPVAVSGDGSAPAASGATSCDLPLFDMKCLFTCVLLQDDLYMGFKMYYSRVWFYISTNNR